MDARLAREIYLDALTAAHVRGSSGGSACVPARSRSRASCCPSPRRHPRPADLLLDGLATLITDGSRRPERQVLRAAFAAFARRDIEPIEALRWRWLAGRAAGFIWDYEGMGLAHDAPHQSRTARRARSPSCRSPSARVSASPLTAATSRAAASLVEEARRARRGDRRSHRPAVRSAHGAQRSAVARTSSPPIRRDGDRGVPGATARDGRHAMRVGDRPPATAWRATTMRSGGSRAGDRGSRRAVVLQRSR